jgi:hypothetical protein
MQALEAAGYGPEHETQLYAVWFLQAIFTPFNAIIFFRPRYLAARNNAISRLQAVRLAVSGPYFGLDADFAKTQR